MLHTLSHAYANGSTNGSGDSMQQQLDQARLDVRMHEAVHALNGSISAEHGIGQLKREELLRYNNPV